MSDQGVVKWYSIAKGYGFICHEDGAEVFVHFSEIPAEGLSEGEQVRFELVDGPKGLKACKVERAGQAAG